MMMGQLSQRILSVVAGKILSHPEVQDHHLWKSPGQLYKRNSGIKHYEMFITSKEGYKKFSNSSNPNFTKSSLLNCIYS